MENPKRKKGRLIQLDFSKDFGRIEKGDITLLSSSSASFLLGYMFLVIILFMPLDLVRPHTLKFFFQLTIMIIKNRSQNLPDYVFR